MRGYGFTVCVLLSAVGAAPAFASEIAPETAIRTYCEPLIAGSTATRIKDAAKKDGLREEVVAGQPVLRTGELLVGISDAPRVCFVQAPRAMSLQQGFTMADAWAKRHIGAVRGAANKGPDGAPVRAWTVPGRKMALIATQQTAASGQRVMNFILMPLPESGAARR